jgi:hypothetical protein
MSKTVMKLNVLTHKNFSFQIFTEMGITLMGLTSKKLFDKTLAGVNFINVKRARFVSFFNIHVTRKSCQNVTFVQKMRAKNVDEIDTRGPYVGRMGVNVGRFTHFGLIYINRGTKVNTN